jgi:hypothetical protein
MSSAVDIYNLALGHLGDEATVSSPTESSVQAEHCNRFYPMARDAMLAGHAWSFATKRISLALLSTDETPDTWDYAYALPSTCLEAISVLEPGAEDDADTSPFIIEALQNGTLAVFTNVEDATLRYIEQITDTTKFPPLFVLALARLLASMLAGPIIKGEAGMKVQQAHLAAYQKVDRPAAESADSRGRKFNKYKDFIPDGLKARL